MTLVTRVRHFLEMIRFSHTVFALPFALLSALMAWWERARATPAEPWRWRELLGVVLCMVFARSAAMATNRLADRRLDAENPRTAGRHIPAGILSAASVLAMALFCGAAFVAATLLFLPNIWPAALSLPVLAFLCGYSYAKRFTALAHFWLGAALALSPIAAWIAVRGAVSLAPAMLGGAILFWVAGFDIIYACQDADVDRRLGLHSVPARLGVPWALRVSALCHAGTVGLLLALPLAFPAFGWLYLAGVGAVGALLVYEHALVRPDDLSRVNVAFFQVNAVISLGLLGLGMVELWRA